MFIFILNSEQNLHVHYARIMLNSERLGQLHSELPMLFKMFSSVLVIIN